jgi:transcriptional regulator with XRE-family HTH domain
MTKNGENEYAMIGRRLSELRKIKKLSQSQIALQMTPKKTQAWVSNVESGSRSISVENLSNMAKILGSSAGELLGDLSITSDRPMRSLSADFDDIRTRLPIEMPMYLQRDLGTSGLVIIDYQYASSVSGHAIFDENHPLARPGSLNVMVVERYYSAPKLDVTDLITYTESLLPIADEDRGITERVLIKLHETYDGLYVHPALISTDGRAEFTLSKAESVVFETHEFDIIGVAIMRRTMYRSSVTRRWLQREFGIYKNESET